MVDVLNRCCRVAVECIDDNDSPHGFREGLLYNVKTTDEQIRKGIAGNTCRCTGYQNIFKSIRMAAAEMEKR